MKEIGQADRIKRFGINCTLNDNGVERHFCQGHEYVEIGGIKWATMNVGAEKVTDCGKYFAWGETEGFINASEKRFTWEDYKFGYDTSKYNKIDGKTVLEPIDDAATANMGSGWRMPTIEEYVALSKAVNAKLTSNFQGSGVAGLVCTDKRDSSKVLFFPACGYCGNNSALLVGHYGYYWSSSDSSYVKHAIYLSFSDGRVRWHGISYRFYGYTVRGVVG